MSPRSERLIYCQECDTRRVEAWPPPGDGSTTCPGCGEVAGLEDILPAEGQGRHPVVYMSPAGTPPWLLEEPSSLGGSSRPE